jgi:hypothetical protein
MHHNENRTYFRIAQMALRKLIFVSLLSHEIRSFHTSILFPPRPFMLLIIIPPQTLTKVDRRTNIHISVLFVLYYNQKLNIHYTYC